MDFFVFVGGRTFGSGVLQEIRGSPQEPGVRVPVCRGVRPEDKKDHKRGLSPDPGRDTRGV
ncbi:MAG: hypothetical protein KJ936_03225 [Proteobacteria bacterium]|nr:hypothetical protein [Pseudomonadota bacterium]MBU2226670.1 hypothetical protein [Pseudomonadota bacterium]MBU2261069.1 hypothetical protein [Pseudomonadota bacterium]